MSFFLLRNDLRIYASLVVTDSLAPNKASHLLLLSTIKVGIKARKRYVIVHGSLNIEN